ncbi:MAG: hypothetical protein F6J93_19410 [Oscillatoria sp. SIO1A7]|nr:hypothetical protein [Oscillatoria sp. SIO1A7]
MQTIASYQRAIADRISPIIENFLQGNPLFADLTLGEIVGVIVPLIEDNFSSEELRAMDDSDLSERVRGVMGVEVMWGLLADLTPEQMVEFDAALSRSKGQ